MLNDRQRAWVILVLAIGQIATTFWPLTGLGQDVQARSDAFPTPLVPAGWTFAIWGVIYLCASAYAIWQFLPANRVRSVNRHVGGLIAYMYLVNTLWQVWVSVMGFGLVDFLALASEAAVGTIVLFRVNQLDKMGWQSRIFAVIPVALLTGWTTAASFVGSTVSASAMGMAWATQPGVGAGILGVAIVFAAVIGLGHRHAAYALAVAWASWGLHANAMAKNLELIQALALGGMLVMLAVAVFSDGWRVYNQHKPGA